MRAFISLVSLLATIALIVALLFTCFFVHNLSSNLSIDPVDPGTGVSIPPPSSSVN